MFRPIVWVYALCSVDVQRVMTLNTTGSLGGLDFNILIASAIYTSALNIHNASSIVCTGRFVDEARVFLRFCHVQMAEAATIIRIM